MIAHHIGCQDLQVSDKCVWMAMLEIDENPRIACAELQICFLDQIVDTVFAIKR